MAGSRRTAEGLRYALALEAGRAGTWYWNRRTGEVEWDPALEAINGLEEGAFGGRFEDWVARIHPDDQEAVLASLDETLAGGGAHHVQYRSPRPDGSHRWIEARGQALTDEAGDIVGMIGVCHDVTERQEVEAERARLLEREQQARQRLEFLSEASGLLARSLNIDDTLRQLAELAVPQLGDLCGIELWEQGEWRPVAIVHTDPEKTSTIRSLRQRYGPAFEHGDALDERAAVYLPAVTDDMLRAAAKDEQHFRALTSIGPRSAIVVGLRSRGLRIGALTLVHADSGRQHTEEDLTLAQELASRAATAIDNAQLFTERSRVAAMLQSALLPPGLPGIPGVELASHYDTPEVDIGGDFYDVMSTGSGWTLLMGDVCGKGVEAASHTALARHTVRAAALHDPDPSHVLGVLNGAFLGDDHEESFCTAACAHLVLDEGRATLTVASGGHPPPLVLRADGTVEEAGPVGLLVGLFPHASYDTATVTLDRGDLVLFYTDGLTEARRGAELYGAERLADVLAEGAGLSAAALVKQVNASVEGFQTGQRDDMAMLALRLLA